ncbi:glycosyltransferase family 4 protein [Roseateles amylovorans]|uniref:Glycosyltransferase family 4 protein n=1 Tax=Roseateles amylovorans TaxID=2978473 RepID=A0ABY6AWU7_9BURK|nr:glycosyltransferase family 4 protein [Roseateles amylovorans]UXH77641.1 glycosyltransferase family 4 protein [Roseateles amylovorans]
MRVLILSQHFWPETFRINEVAESLMAAGCEVTVLTGQPNYPEGRVFDGYRATALTVETHPAGYQIHRVPLYPRGIGGAKRLVANYLSFLAAASVLGPWSLRGQAFDIVFVYGTSPILQAIAGIVLKQIKRAKLVTWVQDLWPQSLEVTGFVRNPRLLALVATVVRWIYRRHDLLLVQSLAFEPPVRAMAGKTPVEYHPNPGEVAFSSPTGSAPPALALPDGFNVVFAGNFGTVQALETVVEAASVLADHSPDIRIVMIGSGSRGPWLEAEIERRGLRNLMLAGRFPPQAMPGLLDQAAAVLVSLNCGEILSQTVPSKVQAYLAAGRPIIASLDGEGARVVEEAGAGIAVPAEDATALAEGILRIHGLAPAARSAMGESGRRYYEQHFAPEALATKLAARFQLLAAGSRGDRSFNDAKDRHST